MVVCLIYDSTFANCRFISACLFSHSQSERVMADSVPSQPQAAGVNKVAHFHVACSAAQSLMNGWIGGSSASHIRHVFMQAAANKHGNNQLIYYCCFNLRKMSILFVACFRCALDRCRGGQHQVKKCERWNSENHRQQNFQSLIFMGLHYYSDIYFYS